MTRVARNRILKVALSDLGERRKEKQEGKLQKKETTLY